MPTVILTPVTPRGEAIVERYGPEWVVIEDRIATQTLTDLDERHQMRVPNAHFTIKEHRND